MKVLLTGATGSIGSTVLTVLLSDSRVTEVLTLSRRTLLSTISSSKLRNVIVDDFSSYTADVLSELDNIDAVIWCIGKYDDDIVVQLEYPKALHDAIVSQPKFEMRKTSIRWIQLGGAVREVDQEVKLWYLEKARKVGGLQQTMVMDWANERWISVVLRPGWIRGNAWWEGLLGWLLGNDLSIEKSEFARCAVEEAVQEGRMKSRLVENREMVSRQRRQG